MHLPVLPTPMPEPDRQDLLRLFLRTQLHWGQSLGEETALDVGTAIVNGELSEMAEANFVIQAALAEDQTPKQAVASVEAHFASKASRCGRWIMNIGSPSQSVDPLAEYLLGHGYHRQRMRVVHLAGAPGQIKEAGGLKIIPGRASYRHFHQLAEAAGDEAGCDQLSELFMLHMEDPNFDSVIALDGTNAVATAGVLSVGDIGRIDQLYVHPAHRRRGLGRTMMSRVLESCARSTFRHVMAALKPEEQPAGALFASLGFTTVGEIPVYCADQSDRSGISLRTGRLNL